MEKRGRREHATREPRATKRQRPKGGEVRTGRRRERTEATQNDEDEMQNRLHKVPGSAIIAHRDWSDLEKAVSEGLGHLRTCFESGTLAENRCHRTWLAGWLIVSVARDEFRSVFFLAATTRSYVIHERRNLTTKPKQSCEPRTATSEVGRWKYFWDNPTISSIITERNRKLFFFRFSETNRRGGRDDPRLRDRLCRIMYNVPNDFLYLLEQQLTTDR